MTRKQSQKMTKESIQQFDLFRKEMHQELANEILDMLQPQYDAGTCYFTSNMVKRNEDHILSYLGRVRAFYNCHERRYLYKNNANLALTIVRLILSSVGHPCYKYGGNRYALASRIIK